MEAHGNELVRGFVLRDPQLLTLLSEVHLEGGGSSYRCYLEFDVSERVSKVRSIHTWRVGIITTCHPDYVVSDNWLNWPHVPDTAGKA